MAERQQALGWEFGGEMGLETQTGWVSAASGVGGVGRLSLGCGRQSRMEETPGESWSVVLMSPRKKEVGGRGHQLSAAEAAEVGLRAEQSGEIAEGLVDLVLGGSQGPPTAALGCGQGGPRPCRRIPEFFRELQCHTG